MAIPSSGQLSLAMIQAEFGGSNPIGLNEYYRGGAYVPNTPTNASIPTSGQIALSHFYGSAAYTPTAVAMPNLSLYEGGVTGVVECYLSLGASTYSGSNVAPGVYLTAGSIAEVEVYATSTGGTGASWGGTRSAWIAASGASWSLSRGTNGTSAGTLSLSFRNKTTLAALDTAAIQFEVYRGPPT